jgi:hypothetical protein
MHSNIARAYDCLRDEHDRVRAACVQILSQNDKTLERELLRANPTCHAIRPKCRISLSNGFYSSTSKASSRRYLNRSRRKQQRRRRV